MYIQFSSVINLSKKKKEYELKVREKLTRSHTQLCVSLIFKRLWMGKNKIQDAKV